MARKLRLEYPGAMYHVINRGNYRMDIFATEGAKQAFEACLVEACAKAHWRLHGFVVMRNHYHLALETPEGNLVEGMRWLQSTYANRFNRWRGESGPVFQGRYRALPVEGANGLGAVGHYIHLNPVRAKIVAVAKLSDYRYGSFSYLQQPRKRPVALTFEAVLQTAGGLADTKAGWRSYASYLEWLAANEPAQKGLAFERMCQGWALGSREFKQALLEEHQEKIEGRSLEREAGTEIRKRGWQAALEACLARAGKSTQAARAERKGVAWKIAIAAHLKATTTVSNPWLAQTLHMGAPAVVSRYVAECKAGKRRNARTWIEKISKG
ncbi:MAG: transposase [Opitutaceae bacterium]